MDNTQTARIAGPKINFLLRLRLWQKFALLGTVAVALAAFPTYRLFKGVQEAIDHAHTEDSGLAAITAALELVRASQDHRGSGSYFVLGDEKRGAAQPKHAAEVDAAMTKLEAIVAPLNSPARRAHGRYPEVLDRAEGQRRGPQDRPARRDGRPHHVIRDMLRLVEELTSVYQHRPGP